MNRSAADPAARSFRSLLGAAAALLVAVLVIAGVRSYKDLATQSDRSAALERRIAETDERIEALERQIDLLETDPGTLERIAREDLGMVKPGDVVVKLATPADGPKVAGQPERAPAAADNLTEPGT